MKRFVVLLFIAIFALAVTAKPPKPSQTITASLVPTIPSHIPSQSSSISAQSSPSNFPDSHRSHHSKTPTSSAAPTPSGKNALFDKISRDGVATDIVCDNADLPPTDGKQSNKTGEITCSSTQQGEIPDIEHMVSTVILTPENGATIAANKAFNVSARTANLNLGFFDNPETQYYSFSQQLDKKGFIMGHIHVTIQKIIDPKQPMDPKQKVFFKGLNDASSNHGVLSAEVTDGLPRGKYRLCTLSSSFAHQPVIMPVAQRGAQDDCIRFNVK